MSENPIITQLTLKQQALIPVYQKKWLKIALSTERIDKKKAKTAVKQGYQWFDIEAPEIIFVDSPNAALKELYEIGCGYLNFSILCDLRHPLINYPYELSDNTTAIKKRMEVEREILKVVLEQNQNIRTQLKEDLEEEIGLVDEYMMNGIQTDDFLIPECCFHDFCISVLKLPYNREKWKVFQNIVKYCGWVFDYKNICIVSNRPTSLSFDEQNNLHADGKPASEYTTFLHTRKFVALLRISLIIMTSVAIKGCFISFYDNLFQI